MRTPPPQNNFVQTRWTLVLRANAGSVEGRAALAELCEAYYRPVYVFLMRMGLPPDTARDHAHSFFAHLLERGFPGADPERGRFRSYLLGAVKHFLAGLGDRARTEKRGGGAAHQVIDPFDDGTMAVLLKDPGAPAIPEVFDQEWAVAVMNRAVKALETEDSGARIAALRPWLMGDAVGSQAETAAALGITEGALRVAVHRLRKRFRGLLRQEIGQTVDCDADVDDELRYLCAVLGQPSCNIYGENPKGGV